MKHINSTLKRVLIFMLCAVMMLFEIIPGLKEIAFTQDAAYNRLISLSIPLTFGVAAVILIASECRVRLFAKPEHLWVLIPGFIIALDNFQWLSFAAGKMELIYTEPLHFVLFGTYCLLVGFFEEILFRGIFLSVVASLFERTKKGLIWTYLISSVAFGAIHLLNVFQSGGGAILQAGYSILTGGLFGFVFIKTKNILFPAIIHAVYNFCGLLYSNHVGLGAGAILDVPTGIMMAIISVCVGIFVLICVWKYPNSEQETLYDRLGVKGKSEGNRSI